MDQAVGASVVVGVDHELAGGVVPSRPSGHGAAYVEGQVRESSSEVVGFRGEGGLEREGVGEVVVASM